MLGRLRAPRAWTWGPLSGPLWRLPPHPPGAPLPAPGVVGKQHPPHGGRQLQARKRGLHAREGAPGGETQSPISFQLEAAPDCQGQPCRAPPRALQRPGRHKASWKNRQSWNSHGDKTLSDRQAGAERDPRRRQPRSPTADDSEPACPTVSPTAPRRPRVGKSTGRPEAGRAVRGGGSPGAHGERRGCLTCTWPLPTIRSALSPLSSLASLVLW